jgi:hypothetical protein
MEEYRPSVDVLIGGTITFLVAVFGVAMERRWANQIRKKERLERLSAIAFSIQVKIAAGHGWSRSVFRSIEDCFEDARNGPSEELDPGLKVKPLVGVRAPGETFSAEELSLLLETGDQGLAEALMAFQWRSATAGALLEEFNDARRQLSSFLSERMLEGEFLDEQTGRISLPASSQHAVEAQVASLNGMVGEFFTELPDLMTTSKQLMIRVESAVQSIDGLTLRTVKFQE